jgi:D-glycerate 3-kinase
VDAADLILTKIAEWHRAGVPLVVGLCGPQGSGKSTIAACVAEGLTRLGLRNAIVSLDDLYLDRPQRAELATKAHPLFATRGPPGTHDVALGIAVLDALRAGQAIALPRFDKGDDNPVPRADWPRIDNACDVILFEGWCVGTPPQCEADLIDPINTLERSEDAAGQWRSKVNASLAGAYQQLWARIDRLVLLTAPDFLVVSKWRREQEQALIARGAPAAMNDAQIARFIQHYERLTGHIAGEMPERADMVIMLDVARRVTGSRSK